MSYLRPTRWWMLLFRALGRCQRKTLQEQWDCGVRCFDLRVSFTLGGRAVFSHGLIDFHLPVRFHPLSPFVSSPYFPVRSVLHVLNVLAANADTPVYVRFILEKKRHEADFTRFAELCRIVHSRCPHLTFIGGVYKNTWERLYDFLDPIPEARIAQPVASMAADAHWYERLIPILYTHRSHESAVNDNTDIILNDFI